MGAKAGIDIDGTRAKHERLATLPFDPTYKLMATFNRTVEGGKEVVRVYVKGAGPAVLGRCAIAWTRTRACPWMTRSGRAWTGRWSARRRGPAGHGGRQKDLDPATFDPKGDLPGYRQELQLRSLVGYDRPGARHLQACRRRCAGRPHPGAHGDRRRRHHGRQDRRCAGIPGRAVLGEEFAALTEEERLKRIDDIGVVGRVAPQHKVLPVETLRKKGEVVAMTGDASTTRPPSRPPTSASPWARAPRSPRTPAGRSCRTTTSRRSSRRSSRAGSSTTT
ncbi:MAG: hypothetical protein U0869_05115 [Chloroflexota bacterium]